VRNSQRSFEERALYMCRAFSRHLPRRVPHRHVLSFGLEAAASPGGQLLSHHAKIPNFHSEVPSSTLGALSVSISSVSRSFHGPIWRGRQSRPLRPISFQPDPRSVVPQSGPEIMTAAVPSRWPFAFFLTPPSPTACLSRHLAADLPTPNCLMVSARFDLPLSPPMTTQ